MTEKMKVKDEHSLLYPSLTYQRRTTVLRLRSARRGRKVKNIMKKMLPPSD